MTPECPEAHLFERELAEQFGLRPEGHPWLKPVRFQHSQRPGPLVAPFGTESSVGVTDFFRVKGEEMREVAVGPVHAGVIEPGHFRFQCHGEKVFHLESSLGYQHRGIERALVGKPNKQAQCITWRRSRATQDRPCDLVLPGGGSFGRLHCIRAD